MLSRCHQPGNMGHIHHQIGSHLVCHFTEPLKVNFSGVSAGPCHDQLGSAFHGNPLQLIIINIPLIIHPIRHNMKIQAREIHLASVSQMAAMVQVHPHNRIPWL